MSAQYLAQATDNSLTQRRHRVENLIGSIRLLDPRATLTRGYSIARDAMGNLLRSSEQIGSGDAMRVDFATGWAEATVNNKG